MAIKQKVPSPQKIKNTPQSFTEQELNELKNLRDKIDEMSFQFGQLSIQKIKLEEQEISLKTQLNQIEKKESTRQIINKASKSFPAQPPCIGGFP